MTGAVITLPSKRKPVSLNVIENVNGSHGMRFATSTETAPRPRLLG